MHFFDCDGFMLSPENQLKVHALHGPLGEEEQTALKDAFWGSFEEPITGFCLAQMLARMHSTGLKANPPVERQLQQTCVKMSHLDMKWWGFLRTASKRWLAKMLCVPYIVRMRLKRSLSGAQDVCCLLFPGPNVIPVRTSALPHLRVP